MKRIFSLLLVTAICTFSLSLSAQDSPVTWNFKTVYINDSIAELQFTATIQKDGHLFSQKHNNGIENPLCFHFATRSQYERMGDVIEPTPVSHYDAMFGDTSLYFVGKVTFIQKIKILVNEDFVISGQIDGQTCIDEKCVALEQTFSFNIKGNKNSPRN